MLPFPHFSSFHCSLFNCVLYRRWCFKQSRKMVVMYWSWIQSQSQNLKPFSQIKPEDTTHINCTWHICKTGSCKILRVMVCAALYPGTKDSAQTHCMYALTQLRRKWAHCMQWPSRMKFWRIHWTRAGWRSTLMPWPMDVTSLWSIKLYLLAMQLIILRRFHILEQVWCSTRTNELGRPCQCKTNLGNQLDSCSMCACTVCMM